MPNKVNFVNYFFSFERKTPKVCRRYRQLVFMSSQLLLSKDFWGFFMRFFKQRHKVKGFFEILVLPVFLALIFLASPCFLFHTYQGLTTTLEYERVSPVSSSDQDSVSFLNVLL